MAGAVFINIAAEIMKTIAVTETVAAASPKDDRTEENSLLSRSHPNISEMKAMAPYTVPEINSFVSIGRVRAITAAIPITPALPRITVRPDATVRTVSLRTPPTMGMLLETANLRLRAATPSVAAASVV